MSRDYGVVQPWCKICCRFDNHNYIKLNIEYLPISALSSRSGQWNVVAERPAAGPLLVLPPASPPPDTQSLMHVSDDGKFY